ncbi:MAG: hypothetical protein EA377_01095 [Phycisphaerales bacterium]|nr:MAG: hypothetical protein EA377_01095 [Phycisphaerales bacterium]
MTAIFNAVINPDTCRREHFTDKDARNETVTTFRICAQQSRKNLSMNSAPTQPLGLPADDTTLTPIPAPVSVPLLAVLSANPSQHT